LQVVRLFPRRIGVLLLIVACSASCRTADVATGSSTASGAGPSIVQPGAPGQPTQVISTEQAVDLSRVPHTGADVRFMQGMIGHHAQALEMTALLATRTRREDMRLLAQRIDASQSDEIALMQRWLRTHGADVPDAHAHHVHGAPLMPGMLTDDQMAQLAGATGPDFDRLFLEFMIKHHIGALTMVGELFGTAGAGQEAEIFAFASDVDADQRIEIKRMGTMLQELSR
jgi:uncharacterized protein (DUF305 family)